MHAKSLDRLKNALYWIRLIQKINLFMRNSFTRQILSSCRSIENVFVIYFTPLAYLIFRARFSCNSSFLVITIKYFICQLIARDHAMKLIKRFLDSIMISRKTVFLAVLWLWLALSVLWSPLKEFALYKALCFSEILIFFAMIYHFALNKANLYKHIKMAIMGG
jgi:hypothetical protein